MFDVKDFGKVAVLMGGISAERDVSLASGAAVLKGLCANGVDAHGIDASPQNIGTLQAQGFDRAFIALHGRWGEDGVVQGALEAVSLPYTGSGVLGCALAMDKVRTKQIWQRLALPTPEFRVLKNTEDLDGLIYALGLPLFLKPAREGSSVGIAKVSHSQELKPAYEQAAAVGDTVLAEQYIGGAELTIAILNGETLPIIELRTSNTFYDYQAKYESNDTQYLCPASLPAELEREISELSLRAFEALDCGIWGRVDLLLDDAQRPQLLEVNTVPGMTDHSLVPMAAAAAGIDFNSLVSEILATTLEVSA